MAQTIEKMWNVKVSTTNKEFLNSVCRKKQTYDSILTEIFNLAKPFLEGIQRLNNKKRDVSSSKRDTSDGTEVIYNGNNR